MEPENDALAAVLHAVRRGGVSASRTVARHYRDEAEMGLERSIQRDFKTVGRTHLINADNGTQRIVAFHRHLKSSLLKAEALLGLRRDARSQCFQGCAYLIAGRPADVVRTLHDASSSTRDSDLASAIDLTRASALRSIGALNEWLDSLRRCAARQHSSLRVVGRVFGTFAALRTGNCPEATRLLRSSYEASQEDLCAAHSELAEFVVAAGKVNPAIAHDLKYSLRKIDVRGLWVKVLEDATN